MAQIDPNIALSIRPAQIESPLVHAARAAELQGAQQSQFMNMLKMKEYVDESRTKNAMMKWLSGKTAKDLESDQNINELATKFGPQGLALAKQIDDRRKAQGEAEYRQAQITDLKSQGVKREYDVNKSRTEDAIKTISGFTNRQQALDMLYQSEANGTIPRDAAENIRRAIPDNEEEFPAFKQSLIERLMTPNERMKYQQEQRDRNAPKWELKKVGAKEMLVDTNPYSETVGQMKPNTEALVDTTPKWELKKIGNREVLVDTNSFSPTVGQMKPGVEALVDTTPKPEKIEQNGRISFLDMNPNSPTYGQPTGAMQEIVDTAPKWTARDIGGSITYVDENQNSPTFGQQKEGAALTKTPTPAAVTPSKVVQLQTELASAEKTYGPNSPQAKQIRDEIEQETGGLERQRIAIDRYRSRKGDGSGSSIGPGTKLEKGEIWNEAEQRIETVPGSKLNIAQSNAHGKDRSALVAVETKTNSAINKIDEILDPKNQDGFDANFSGMVPYGGFVTGRFAPDSRRKIESLKADMKSAGLELIRQGGSIGQITEREWPILEAMIAGISPEMTPEAARAEFKKVRAYMQKLKANAKDAYQTEWGDTQYFKPSPGGSTSKAPAVGTIKDGYKFKGGNPADAKNWEKVK
jgi:hypothetical protein